jgi:predicted GNAT family acetyltransferase
VLGTASLRVLGSADLAAALEIAHRNPVTNVFVESRLLSVGLLPAALGAEVWGYEVHGRLESLCYVGANVVPVQAGPQAVHAFADQAAGKPRRCSSIVGPAAAVGPLWERLAAAWGPARDVRPSQPVMAVSTRPRDVPPDPRVRRVEPADFETVLPACVAMFTEEVGVSPYGGDGGALYRSRVRELITSRRAFARIESGKVLFKAEIGAVTPYACQVQGVWVDPEYRGAGLSVIGMAAVVDIALAEIAPVVSLYVNDYNVRAVAAYRHVGFQQVDTFMSVLF